ncbi:8514_t:CDS:2 [Paraglomus occultum]|uniref:8514_t:CDS:1 n=1 Tax=Paraglomus occultum TaxID=144539 RepID=A0A9N9GW26_9GLOM|nr:8514_t:CDS:2 [Paraglomus occultum]
MSSTSTVNNTLGAPRISIPFMMAMTSSRVAGPCPIADPVRRSMVECRNLKLLNSENLMDNNSHLFVPFNDITVHTTSQDLLNLLLGLTEKSYGSLIKLNVNAHERTFKDIKLGEGAAKMLTLPNAGGTSMLSEVFSCEIMERILGVELSKTEMEVRYRFSNQPMTDYLVKLRHKISVTIGISVTRAYAYKKRYTSQDARALLKKKLTGISSSTKNIIGDRVWKQILHIWCPDGHTAKMVKRAYSKMKEVHATNTVIVLSVVESGWVFHEAKRKKKKKKPPRRGSAETQKKKTKKKNHKAGRK